MAQKLTLTFMSGSRDGEVIHFDAVGLPPSVSIGREAPSDLVITDDPDISRRHARIFWDKSIWMLEDLGSSNGTFLGEFQAARRLAAPTAIKEGQIFRTGLTRFRLGSSQGEHFATAAAAANATRS